MYRHASRPRQDWRKKVESQGLVYVDTPTPDGGAVPYWFEEAFYEFTLEQVDTLEAVTVELHAMCVEAARYVLDHPSELEAFDLPPAALGKLRESLDDPSLYGRFDLVYDGLAPAKLLEYNADTPTGLVESAAAQWFWLEEVMPSCDQWNSLHDRLVQRWAEIAPRLRASGPGPKVLHLATVAGEDSGEEWMTVAYLEETAKQAGLRTVPVAIEDLGWDSTYGRLVDAENRPVLNCFKLYPWEDMLADRFGRLILDRSMDAVLWIEPAWKSILSNKALLALLWRLHPDHPNLVPAYLDGPRDLDAYVAKPLHGREGAGILVDSLPTSEQVARAGGYCFQQRLELPSFEGNHPVLGSWVVGDQSAGLGIREQDALITDEYARFVPHAISEPHPSEEQVQAWLRERQAPAR
jgi:glutathionylspermidine synthase